MYKTKVIFGILEFEFLRKGKKGKEKKERSENDPHGAKLKKAIKQQIPFQ
jgi:hypothetical protein